MPYLQRRCTFHGWKLVVKMFKSRRDRIADELEQAKQAKEKAENIRAGLDKARAGGDAQGEAIIAKAKETAERSSEEARRADEKSAADIAAVRAATRADRLRAAPQAHECCGGRDNPRLRLSL